RGSGEDLRAVLIFHPHLEFEAILLGPGNPRVRGEGIPEENRFDQRYLKATTPQEALAEGIDHQLHRDRNRLFSPRNRRCEAGSGCGRAVGVDIDAWTPAWRVLESTLVGLGSGVVEQVRNPSEVTAHRQLLGRVHANLPCGLIKTEVIAWRIRSLLSVASRVSYSSVK